MKITQIMLSKGFGGAERAFVDTAICLASRGHKVQVICHRRFGKLGELQTTPNIQVDAFAPINKNDFISLLRIRNAMKAFGSDVAHIHLNRAATLGGCAASMAKIPWVGTFHNYYSIKGYKKAQSIFAITEDVRQWAIQQGRSAEQVVVVPNFSRVGAVESSHQGRGAPLRVLSYGRYVHKKGFDVMLKAFTRLIYNGVNATLSIGGNGPEAAGLASLCDELGLGDKVSMGVWIDDVVVALDQADVFVLPSRDEPFGIVMLEAMARGVPIISTRSQGPSQVLTDETAFFAEIDSEETLADALLLVTNRPELANEKAAVALELYRTTYHEDAVLPQLEALYLSVSSR